MRPLSGLRVRAALRIIALVMGVGRTGPRGRKGTRPWSLRAFLVILRAVALLVSVQVSGALHLAVDLAPMAFDVAFEHDDCSHDTGEDTCPPSCPHCHCCHGRAGALPPPSVSFAELPSPPRASDWRPVAADEIPQGPDLSSVYRPPKSPRVRA